MFSNNGARIRRLTAIILAIMSVCMVMPAQAETAAVDTLFGEVRNETYENAFLGLGCTLEGWHYYTDEELEKVNQRTKEALSNALDDLVDRNIGIMMAEGPDGKQNVNIQLQNVKNYTAIYKMMGLEYVATNSLDGYKIRDIQVYFKQLWEIQDNYLVTVTATAYLEDTTDEVFSKFFLL